MATYAMANNSGSAGKTTTVVSMGTLLAQRGYTVRILDLDPQANASTWLGYPGYIGSTTGANTAGVLRATATIADAERPARVAVDVDDNGVPVYDDAHYIQNLTIVPAVSEDLSSLMIQLSQTDGALLNLADALQAADPVDVTLIDCPGTLNILTTIALLAVTADEQHGLITCVKPAAKEIEGLPGLLKELHNTCRLYSRQIDLVSIVPCAVPAQGAVYEEQLESLQAWQGEKVTPPVRRRTIVDDSYAHFAAPTLYDTPSRRRDIVADYDAVLDHQIAQGLFPTRVHAA